ncbi:hypothetical protein NQ314_012494, partial [Rhamnusium bicolor]
IEKMVMCWASECKHYIQRETCKFFKFPKDAKERMRWKKFIRRFEEPGPGAFLCSCHFPGGKRENGPELFQHNITKRFSYTSPEKNDKERLKLTRSDVAEALANITRTQSGIPEDIHQAEIERATSPTASIEATENIYLNPQPSKSRAADDKDILSTTMLNAENYFLRRELEQKESMRRTVFTYEELCHFDNSVSLYTSLPNAGIFDSVYQLLENIEVNYYLEWNLEKKFEKQEKRINILEKEVKSLKSDTEEIKIENDNIQQYSRRNNVRIFGVKEMEKEKPEDEVFKLINEKIGVNLQSWDIEVCHRVGIKAKNKERAILVKFSSNKTKNEVLYKKKALKGTKVVIREDLTQQKIEILKIAVEEFGAKNNTWKALIGVAPNGVVTFVSDLYPGSTSDKKIVQHCKILEQMKTADLILADKGFLLKDILPPGVNLNIPLFLVTSQFTPEQVYRTETIARARIHVERTIRRMKCYKILVCRVMQAVLSK